MSWKVGALRKCLMKPDRFPRLLNNRRKQQLLRGLAQRLSGHRQRMEEATRQLAHDREQALGDFQSRSQALAEQQRRDLEEAITAWDQAREDIWSQRDRATLQALRQETKQLKELQEAHQRARQQQQSSFQQTKRKLDEQYEEDKPRPAKQLERYLETFRSLQAKGEAILDEYQALAAAQSVSLPAGDGRHQVQTLWSADHPQRWIEHLSSEVATMQGMLEQTRKNFWVRFAGSVAPWLFGLLPGVIVSVVAWRFFRAAAWWAGGISLATLVLVPVMLAFSILPRVRRFMAGPYRELLLRQSGLAHGIQTGVALAEQQCRQEEQRLLKAYQERLKGLELDHQQRLEKLDQDLHTNLQKTRKALQANRVQAAAQAQARLMQLDAEAQPKLDARRQRQHEETEAAQVEHRDQLGAIDRRSDEVQRNLKQRIEIGTNWVANSLAQQRMALQERFPSWQAPGWEAGDWPLWPDTQALPIGEVQIKLDDFEAALPLEFDWLHGGLLILEAAGAARDRSRATVQALLARAYTSLPMGHLQCTIIDPEGLGRDFAWLMPLADIDPKLVGHRVWTQSHQIAEQLALLVYQTEDTIQQRLRDRYSDLAAYNAEAGPMAEPLRLVVWPHFPVGLDEAAWRSLCALAAAGPRCGIGILLTIDHGQAWPPFADPEKLMGQALRLNLNSPVHVVGGELERFPLTLAEPPSLEQLRQLMVYCAQAAAEAGRLEVPFESIQLAPSEIGQGTSPDGLVIPLGVAGIGRVTHMRLGQGTAQHVLIAGKTGSGKSSLLHTLITSATMKYSPAQLRMVLLDFKKGVEFQVYAHARLPHAEIIGIESRREFGLSALEYLDRVMQRRGELFREAGVQDLPSWARKRPDQPLPRLLVIVDEFQEMFIEDDKLTQQAAMLLDRIVRQGRSFGIQMVMASQSIGGAYSLPRTTLAQMAVRIALQCDSADAMTILHEDNLAATRLRHSGQAIYNDAGGRIESNQPFQVAFIRSQEHAAILAQLPTDDSRSDPSTNLLGRQIIFEGHCPARWNRQDIERGLAALPQAATAGLRLVLGESLSIEPTVVRLLPRQAGRNAMVVGNDPKLAGNLLATMSRAWFELKEAGPAPAIHFLDGARAEDPHVSGLRSWLTTAAASHAGSVVSYDPRSIEAAMGGIAEELQRRMEQPDQPHDPWLLMIANLGRFRELRKSEEFSFGMPKDSGQPAPDEAFAQILRDGPGVGIHTLLWVDSWGTLARFIPRPGLRDLEIRILMPMSANDSNQLIDSSAANKLEPHALILFDEIDGKIVKFRPYQFPLEPLEASPGRDS